jgi:hypothetical protein
VTNHHKDDGKQHARDPTSTVLHPHNEPTTTKMASSMHGTPQVQCCPTKLLSLCLPNRCTSLQTDLCRHLEMQLQVGIPRVYTHRVCLCMSMYITASNARQPGSVKFLECPKPLVRHICIITVLPPWAAHMHSLPSPAPPNTCHARPYACTACGMLVQVHICKWHAAAACSAFTAQQRSTPQW